MIASYGFLLLKQVHTRIRTHAHALLCLAHCCVSSNVKCMHTQPHVCVCVYVYLHDDTGLALNQSKVGCVVQRNA